MVLSSVMPMENATPASDIIDAIPYDGRTPNAYIDSLPIGLKSGQTVLDGEVQG